MDKLANEWDIHDLEDWGVEVAGDIAADIEEEDMEKYEKAKQLKKRDNFIILKFEEDIDWIQALSYFNIKKEELPSTKRNCDGKLKRIGEGYVIDGADFINKIEEIRNENKL